MLEIDGINKGIGYHKEINLTDSAQCIKIGISDSQCRELLAYCIEPKTKAELMKFIGEESRSSFERKILTPLLESGRILMTNPESPRSPKQKYYSMESE